MLLDIQAQSPGTLSKETDQGQDVREMLHAVMIQEDKLNGVTPKEVYHAFRLIVTQVVYDREAQFGEETISRIARWEKAVNHGKNPSHAMQSKLPPESSVFVGRKVCIPQKPPSRC